MFVEVSENSLQWKLPFYSTTAENILCLDMTKMFSATDGSVRSAVLMAEPALELLLHRKRKVDSEKMLWFQPFFVTHIDSVTVCLMSQESICCAQRISLKGLKMTRRNVFQSSQPSKNWQQVNHNAVVQLCEQSKPSTDGRSLNRCDRSSDEASNECLFWWLANVLIIFSTRWLVFQSGPPGVLMQKWNCPSPKYCVHFE